MRDANPQAIRLDEYTPPAFLISDVSLDVDIREASATVRARLQLSRNAKHPNASAPLVLDGKNLELLSVSIDGRALGTGEFEADDAHLVIGKVPAGAFT